MSHAKGSRIQIGLPQFPAGVPDDLFNQFFLIYQSINNLADQLAQYAGVDEWDDDEWNQLTVDQTVWQINPTRFYAKQVDAVAFGACISLFVSGGTLQVRKANATDATKPAIGFVSSTNHVVAIGSFCEVTIGVGLILGVAGLIVPARYFLSTTDGIITNAAPVAVGNIEQVVGVALASNRLLMNITQAWIQH